jgi:choline kinase
MKLIILAAGKGQRLMPLTRNTPKPLLDMGNGYTLLEEQMRAAQASGVVDETVLVVGYLASQVEAKLEYHRDNGLCVRTVYNPFYEVSNNLMSLWLARHEMTTDFMITNGDNLFAAEVFRGLAGASRDGITLSVSPKTVFDADDMRVTLDAGAGAVLRVSKQLADDESQAESPGLALVRGSRARTIFADHLERMVRQNGYLKKFWLEVFNHLADQGVRIAAWPFDGAALWREVDFHDDVTGLRNALQLKVQPLLATAGRH